MSFEKSTAVATKLRVAGVNSAPYAKGPAGKDIFIVGNPNADLIKVWVPEHVEVAVAPDKKRHQAVISLHEDERTVEALAYGRFTLSRDALRGYDSIDAALDAIVAKQVRSSNPIALTGVKRTTQKVHWTKKTKSAARGTARRMLEGNYTNYYNGGEVVIPVKYSSLVRAQDLCFLVGIDESSHFVSQLPRTVKSVEEAHVALRPKGWKEDWLRQGEWFFAPVKSRSVLRMLEEVDAVSRTGFRNVVYSKRGPKNHVRMERDSSHYIDGTMKHYNGANYVTGTVRDTRTSHHSPLELNGWHRVYRNTELVVAVTTKNKQRARWD